MYISRANDPLLRSWVEVPAGHDFPIQNLPFGIASWDSRSACMVSAIGDFVIDLSYLQEKEYFAGIGLPQGIFRQAVLNGFIALGKELTCAVRDRLSILLEDSPEFDTAQGERDQFLVPTAAVQMHLPLQIGDYTDFYSSMEHATNVGMMFRDPANALLPNWKHLPVGYHGRSSSILVSGQALHRPKGQTKPPSAETPLFGPSMQVDFELEMAFVIGKSNALGQALTTEQAPGHIFGLALFNDWSARDIQAWEYVPLGPFLAKNFASTLSPWIITLEALEPFRIAGPLQDPPVLDYLKFQGEQNYNIALEVAIQPQGGAETTVCRSNFRHMYWNMAQQLAHHTVNGCNMQVGDLCASGTISGPTPDSYGSMLELAWRATRPLDIGGGQQRSFIEDGDTVILRGYAEANGVRIGFGEAKAQLLPAL